MKGHSRSRGKWGEYMRRPTFLSLDPRPDPDPFHRHPGESQRGARYASTESERGLRKGWAAGSRVGTAGLRPEGRGHDRRPEREKRPPPLHRVRGVRSGLGRKYISPSILVPGKTHITSHLFAPHRGLKGHSLAGTHLRRCSGEMEGKDGDAEAWEGSRHAEQPS